MRIFSKLGMHGNILREFAARHERHKPKKLTEGKAGIPLINNLEEVVDAVIHGLTAKYPKRRYQIGWDMFLKIMVYAPLCITEPLMIWVAKKQREALKKL